jgi:hypothetical protein
MSTLSEVVRRIKSQQQCGHSNACAHLFYRNTSIEPYKSQCRMPYKPTSKSLASMLAKKTNGKEHPSHMQPQAHHEPAVNVKPLNYHMLSHISYRQS